MDPLLIALAVGLVAGILIGGRVAARSAAEVPIYGGGSAKLLHRLACMAFAGTLPSGLTAIILGHNFGNAVVMAFAFVGVSFLLLVLYATVENGPRKQALASDQGWTAEKARTSGL